MSKKSLMILWAQIIFGLWFFSCAASVFLTRFFLFLINSFFIFRLPPSVYVLGEKLHWTTYVGCALILLGVMLVNKLIRVSGRNRPENHDIVRQMDPWPRRTYGVVRSSAPMAQQKVPDHEGRTHEKWKISDHARDWTSQTHHLNKPSTRKNSSNLAPDTGSSPSLWLSSRPLRTIKRMI